MQLEIKGLGHVPAFKNKKIIVGGKQKRLITAPKARKWMESAQKLLYSQLKSRFQTTDGATSTVRWQQCAMSLWPPDDNCKVITEIHVSVKKVPKGEEGCTIWIEKISPVD